MTEVPVAENLETEASDTLPAGVPEAVAAIESNTPGAVLRRAREARGQSVADVVQVIRFSAHQIEALERDDYASLPGATSVRGLVRNYARFLKLDATPLLIQLDPAVPVTETDVRPPANMGGAEQPTIVERVPPRFIAAGAAILLLALGAYWLASLPGDGGLSSLLRGVSGGSVAPAPGSVPAPSVVPVVQPAPAVVGENPPTAAGEMPGLPPHAGLRVEFDDRSWIEIRDAAQKIVFVGEYPAGTRQNVEGKAPFQVWIGRASAVRVFVGERGIDLKPHTREEVARFSLE
jgi:cytoskeleton protein RodZ